MTVQFNGRRPLRKPGDKRSTNDLALVEVSDENENNIAENDSTGQETKQPDNVRLTPAQMRQQRAADQPEKPKLVSYRGFSMQGGNLREEVLMLSPDDLLPNPFETKMRGPIELQRAEETIAALAREMQKGGFEGALKARKYRHLEGKYELVYGHLRVEAAKRAGIKHIKVGVEELSDREMLSRMFNENALRDDPGPVGDGQTMLALIEAEGLSLQDMADRVGKSNQWVKDRVDLAKMSEQAKDIVRHNPKAYSLILKLGRTNLTEDTKAKYLLLLEKGAKPAQVSDTLRHDLAGDAPSDFAISDDEYDPDLAPFQIATPASTTSLAKDGSKTSSVTPAARRPATVAEQEAAILKLLKGFGDKIEQMPEISFSQGFLEQVQTEIKRLSKLIEQAKVPKSKRSNYGIKSR